MTQTANRLGDALAGSAARIQPPPGFADDIHARVSWRRRRDARRSRAAMAGVVVVALFASLSIIRSVDDERSAPVAANAAPIDSSLPADPDATFVVALHDSLLVVDPGRREALTHTVAGLPSSATTSIVATDNFFVVVKAAPDNYTTGESTGAAYAVPRSLDAATRLSTAVDAFVDADGRHVWLRREVAGVEHLRKVNPARPSARTSPVPLPRGRAAVASTSNGLLVLEAVPDTAIGVTRLEVWSPRTRKIVRTLGASSRLVSVHGTKVAWVGKTATDPASSALLHVTDIKTGADRTVSPPAGTMSFAAGGAFSSDGRRLAAFAVTHAGTDPTAALVAIETDRLSSRLVENSSFLIGESIGHATWTTNNEWVVFGQLGPRLLGFAPATGRNGYVDVPAACLCFRQWAA